MKLLTRRVFSFSKLKRTLLEKLAARRRMKMGDATVGFFLLSYLIYMKKLGKLASLAAFMDKKHAISRDHLYEAHQTILEQTKVKRKQRTLDDMFIKR